MKARSGRLGDTVATLLLLLMGAGLIYGSAFKSDVGQTIADALRIPIVGAGIGLIMVLSVVLRWAGCMQNKNTTFINFDSEDGSVGISTKAICDFVERIGKEFFAVKSIEARLAQKKEAIDITLHVKVLSGSKIPELSLLLQKRVRESVRKSLGIAEIGKIAIKVQEIIGDPVKTAVDSDLETV